MTPSPRRPRGDPEEPRVAGRKLRDPPESAPGQKKAAEDRAPADERDL